MKGLKNISTIPKFIYYGRQDKRDFLVMELLGGEDMAMLRNRIRASCSTGLIALPGASYLAQQMLTCIRSMHERGYLHRDIKPANFVRKDKSSTQFSAIDFGIAKQVSLSQSQPPITQHFITPTTFSSVSGPERRVAAEEG